MTAQTAFQSFFNAGTATVGMAENLSLGNNTRANLVAFEVTLGNGTAYGSYGSGLSRREAGSGGRAGGIWEGLN